MIRPFTLFTAALAIGSGYYLYQAKHRTKLLDDKIVSIEQHTAATEAQIAVLRAEWALENSPSRLAQLAARYLTLTPMRPSQAVSMANLASRLPPLEQPNAAPPASGPEGAAVARLLHSDIYTSLGFFASGRSETRPQFIAVAQVPITPAVQSSAAMPPSAPVSRAKHVASLAVAPAPAATPAPPVKAVRRVLVRPVAERSPPPRVSAAPVLTSALGGAWPTLAPPAPLAGSH